MAMSILTVFWLLVAAMSLYPKTVQAAPTGVPLNYGSVIGLQRNMHLQKKAVVLNEEDDTEIQYVGSYDRKDVNSNEVPRNDKLTLALEDEDAASPDWLEGTALGLQRGFEVSKKSTKPLQQTSAVPAPTSSKRQPAPTAWKQFAPLGLQRGFHVKKAVVSDSEESDVEGTETASWQVSTTLGLQRGFRVTKKAVSFAGALASHRSQEQTNSTAGSTQSRSHGVFENSTFVV